MHQVLTLPLLSQTNEYESTGAELKEVLIDIQINVNNILRDNI